MHTAQQIAVFSRCDNKYISHNESSFILSFSHPFMALWTRIIGRKIMSAKIRCSLLVEKRQLFRLFTRQPLNIVYRHMPPRKTTRPYLIFHRLCSLMALSCSDYQSMSRVCPCWRFFLDIFTTFDNSGQAFHPCFYNLPNVSPKKAIRKTELLALLKKMWLQVPWFSSGDNALRSPTVMNAPPLRPTNSNDWSDGVIIHPLPNNENACHSSAANNLHGW